jgi:hypothetical protein
MARSVRWLVPVRWLVAVASTVGTFVICLWLFRFVSFSWMPSADADRWVVATAFAAVAAGAVGAATGWWAGREHKPPDVPSTKVATQASPPGRQAVTGGEGLAFGPRGDYRGAVFNFQPEVQSPPPLQVPSLPRSATETPVERDTDAPEGSQAAIIPFPGRGGGQARYRLTRSWSDLAEVLQETSLHGQDWVTLAGSSQRLRSELDAERTPEPDLPESVPKLVGRLRDLLRSMTSASASPALLDTGVAEARQIIDLLVRLLNPKTR